MNPNIQKLAIAAAKADGVLLGAALMLGLTHEERIRKMLELRESANLANAEFMTAVQSEFSRRKPTP